MKKIRLTKSTLIAVALIINISFALIQTEKAFSKEVKQPKLYAVEILAQLPAGTFLENLVWDNEGNLYITNNSDGAILKYSYDRKSLSKFASLDYTGSADGKAHPFGIAIDSDGTIYGSAVKQPLGDNTGFIGTNGVYTIDKQGNWKWFMEQVPGALWNGWTYVQPGVFLICDAYAGVIWELNVKTAAITKWLEDPLFTTNEKTPGANGIKIYKNYAYVTTSSQAKILRIPIDEDGKPGQVEVYKHDIKPDDFCIAKNGNIYTTTHPQNVIYLVEKTGKTKIVAGEDDWRVKGNTAAVFGKNNGDAMWIYIIGDGGVWECRGNPSCLKPTALVRIYVGEKGYFKDK